MTAIKIVDLKEKKSFKIYEKNKGEGQTTYDSQDIDRSFCLL